jgi:hypothetical protein
MHAALSIESSAGVASSLSSRAKECIVRCQRLMPGLAKMANPIHSVTANGQTHNSDNSTSVCCKLDSDSQSGCKAKKPRASKFSVTTGEETADRSPKAAHNPALAGNCALAMTKNAEEDNNSPPSSRVRADYVPENQVSEGSLPAAKGTHASGHGSSKSQHDTHLNASPGGRSADVHTCAGGGESDSENDEAPTRSALIVAENLKSSGNAKFVKGYYTDAIQDYADALHMLCRPNVTSTPQVIELQCVCRMNIAASALKKSVGLKKEKEAAETLELAVGCCNDVLAHDQSRWGFLHGFHACICLYFVHYMCLVHAFSSILCMEQVIEGLFVSRCRLCSIFALLLEC